MNPNQWGPKAWYFLDCIVLMYPENPTELDKQNYKTFFQSLANVLPCKKCQINYKNNIIIYPLTDEILSSKDKLIEWHLKIHNEIRKVQKKLKITFSQMKNYYEHSYDTYFIILFLLFSYGYYLYNNYK